MSDNSNNIIPLKGLKVHQFRRKFRLRKAGQITALDLDGSMLRVAQAEMRGDQALVTRIGAAALTVPPDADRSDPAVLGEALRAALEALRLKPGFVVMGVPRAQVILRTLSLPISDDLSELASMVHLQIGKDLPFRKDDAVIDFRVRPQRQSAPGPPPAEAANESGEGRVAAPPATAPKLEALVAVAQKQVVEFYRQLASAAGLKLVGLGLQSYANARCLEACRVAEGSEAVALVSLRPGEVIVDVISERSLVFSRGAAIEPPKHELVPAEAPAPVDSSAEPLPAVEPFNFVDAVTIEVVRSLHSYSGMEPGKTLGKVVLTGATGQEQAVVEALQKRLATPVSLLDVAYSLRVSSSQREHASGAMSAVGLALGIADPEGLPFDFLHPKNPPVQRDMRRIRILASAAAVVTVLFAAFGVRSNLINKRLVVQRQVQAELAAAQKHQPLYRQMRAQHGAIDEWVKQGENWLAHYVYLSGILPGAEELYVTSLTVSGQGTIRLSVQARSGEILARLDKQLREAGYEVKPQAITPGSDKHGYDFRSSVELIVPEKMKIDVSKLKVPPPRPADDASLEGVGSALRRRPESISSPNAMTVGGPEGSGTLPVNVAATGGPQ